MSGMIYRPLGQTGLMVSLLGLGTVKLGRNLGVKYPHAFSLPSEDEAADLLARAQDLGVNLIDTAPAYGASEERLGKLLRGQRQQWIICTKAGEEFAAGESRYDFSPSHLRFSIERSLQRLHSDYLDLLLVHSDGRDREIIEQYDVFGTLAECKRAGLIRAFGMSSKTLNGGLLTARYADLAMVTYNPQHLDDVAVIDECHRLNKGVLIKKAFASGHWVQGQCPDNQDPVQAGLNLVLSHPGVSSVIIGTINPQHLSENVTKTLLALNP